MASCVVSAPLNYNGPEKLENNVKDDATFDLQPKDQESVSTDVDSSSTNSCHDNADGIGYVVLEVEDEDVCDFDRRMSELKSNAKSTRSNGCDNGGELLRINRIFTEVAQALGSEWRPVFQDLMTASSTSEIIESELKSLELLRPLVRGYKALHIWRDRSVGRFSLDKLEATLIKNNHADIVPILHQDFAADSQNEIESRKKLRNSITRRKSDATIPNAGEIDNRLLLLLSKKIGDDWARLALELKVSSHEVEEIESMANVSAQEKAFKALWSWREAATDKTLAGLQLNAGLAAIDRTDLALP